MKFLFVICIFLILFYFSITKHVDFTDEGDDVDDEHSESISQLSDQCALASFDRRDLMKTCLSNQYLVLTREIIMDDIEPVHHHVCCSNELNKNCFDVIKVCF